jgi:hypothetical protein
MSKSKFFILAALTCSSALAQVPSGVANPQNLVVASLKEPAQPDQQLPNKVITVDDLIKSGKLVKETQKKRSIIPTDAPFALAGMPDLASLDGQAEATKTALQPKQILAHGSKSGLSLMGVYISSGYSRAAIDVAGVRKTYAPGDFLSGGWKLLNVNANGVDLERCHKKACSAQFLFLND